jgi:hypothetical protein
MGTSVLVSVVTCQKTLVYSHWKTAHIPHVVRNWNVPAHRARECSARSFNFTHDSETL